MATNTDVLLDKNEKWQEGFEAGIAFLLMIQKCPKIQGVYASISTEQLFLFAHQLGYEFEWKAKS